MVADDVGAVVVINILDTSDDVDVVVVLTNLFLTFVLRCQSSAALFLEVFSIKYQINEELFY